MTDNTVESRLRTELVEAKIKADAAKENVRRAEEALRAAIPCPVPQLSLLEVSWLADAIDCLNLELVTEEAEMRACNMVQLAKDLRFKQIRLTALRDRLPLIATYLKDQAR
jgi:hypothetical protein